MSLELIVALTLATLALGAGLIRAFHTVQEARGRVDKLMRNRLAQVERLRKAVSVAYDVLGDAEKRKVATEAEVTQAEASLKTASAIDHRLYVLDDRRTKADQNWVATIVHPGYDQAVSHNALQEAVEGWRKGRRFLVFALDAAKARDKILARYPERVGYQVVSIEPQPPPKSKSGAV